MEPRGYGSRFLEAQGLVEWRSLWTAVSYGPGEYEAAVRRRLCSIQPKLPILFWLENWLGSSPPLERP